MEGSLENLSAHQLMKIALIIKDFSPQKGGAERYAWNLGRGLVSVGYDVHVFANRWEPTNGIVFHRVPIVKSLSILKIITFPLFCRYLLRKQSFDIVYGLTAFYPLDIYRVSEGLHRDVLRHRYENGRFLRYLNPKHLTILFIENKLFKKGNYKKVIVNSNMIKTHLMEYYDVPDSDIEVVYNGVDLDLFNPSVKGRYQKTVRDEMSIGDEETVILFVANDFYRKGLSYLIRAIASIDRSIPFRCLVVGKDKIGPYKKMARQLGVGDRLIFAGAARSIEMFYGAGNIFVLPTRYDPFSNVCLEAMACGMPIITTKNNGASEIIEEGNDGFIIEDGRCISVLKDRIVRLFDKPFRESVGRRAAEKAREFSIRKNLLKTLEVFREVNG